MSSSLKVLLVDDREDNILALKVALKDGGYELFEAHTGSKAIELASQHDFFVILLDVQMPVLNGFETASRIREQDRSRHTPIIFVTASHDAETNVQLGYDVGAVDYLFKPINTVILRAKVGVFAELYRRAEQLREAAVKEREVEFLQGALRARDEFLSIASHELKGPMTPLNLQLESFIKMFESGSFKDVSSDRILRMLRTSMDQVHRLNDLIDQLLDVSRIRVGKLDISKSVFDLNHAVNEVIRLHDNEIKSSGCSVKILERLPCLGSWDKSRIEQVFTNLLTNAIKYGAGKPIEIEVQCNSQWAQLKVKDFGIGIDRKDHERIFNRFERAVSPANYGGMGLGLYITSQIVEFHEGKIRVESELGKGATFIVELPRGQTA